MFEARGNRLPTVLALGFVLAGPTSDTSLQTAAADQSGLRFNITIDRSVSEEPLTGRVFLAISPTLDPEPRIAAYYSARQRDARVPFFALDVAQLVPGEAAVMDSGAIGFPYHTLDDLPAGDYYVQALLNVYTEFRRSDGHAIWAHMDQWEGQRWAFSPGNLYSEPKRVRLDPGAGAAIELWLTQEIPPITVPEDTRWVKRIKIQSKILSDFWGHPFYLGATLLLPKGYDENPEVSYPAVFAEGHFGLNPPFGFTTEPPSGGSGLFAQMMREARGRRESGYEFYRSWNSDSFPRVIAVTLQHPTPFFDDSYGINSANNGPYGDAIHQELIPHLEEHFRMIGKPYARVLTGGSTGGWISLALQVHYPDFYGGTWTFYPDPVDFRRYQLVNVYDDTSAFIVPNAPHDAPERPFPMTPEGQPVGNVRQLSRMEYAQGTKGRSGGQIDAWNAAYGPAGNDGYPGQVWNMLTGEIDRDVAHYMRDNGYDLRHYLEKNWKDIGPSLVDKIRVYTGDMDHFYLAFAVYLLEEFLEGTTDPYYDGEFVYGRPMKGHGWQPMTNAELIEMMAAHIEKNAPRGADVSRRR